LKGIKAKYANFNRESGIKVSFDKNEFRNEIEKSIG